MSKPTYRQLVESATQHRTDMLEKAFRSHGSEATIAVWARELDAVNKHISVDGESVEEAANSYEELGHLLVERLRWPEDAIKVAPQGSTNTKTLVRAPSAERFDIDAVCEVDISRVDARDPMKFFDEVAVALKDREPEEKNRCLRINFPNKGYYIDFTPSVPLDKIPQSQRSAVRYRPASGYESTALAVVDRPTGAWKTSNPAGFAAWVNEQANRPVLAWLLEKAAAREVRADVAPVPSQEVELSDTLRIAIRLFKRHRDMAVRRGHLEAEVKPISVIIVTLLTQCYAGLADQQRVYYHPIELLLDLASLLPHMVEYTGGEWVIANPTVEEENFAERWNGDGGKRFNAFHRWCTLLASDLSYVLDATDPAEVRERVQQAFGCVGAGSPTPISKTLLTGLAPAAPKKVQPVPPGRGLA